MSPGRQSHRAATLLLAVVFLCAAAGSQSLFGQSLRSDFLVAQLWCELDPLVQEPGQTYPLPKDAAIKQILTEAQFVFGGMLYGFDFVYTPADPARGVADRFKLTPVAEIPWGDPGLHVLQTRTDGSRLFASLLYSLAPFQERWKQSWDSNLFPTASGRGSGSYYGGFPQKLASYRDAIKEAIRGYLRARVYNRPREVRGEVALEGSPSTIIESAKYFTTVTVKLKLDRIEPYKVY